MEVVAVGCSHGYTMTPQKETLFWALLERHHIYTRTGYSYLVFCDQPKQLSLVIDQRRRILEAVIHAPVEWYRRGPTVLEGVFSSDGSDFRVSSVVTMNGIAVAPQFNELLVWCAKLKLDASYDEHRRRRVHAKRIPRRRLFSVSVGVDLWK